MSLLGGMAVEKEGLHFAREDEHVRRWRYCAASHACDGVSHSQQILAPTFQLLGNLQICSGHLGSGRLGKGGSMQEGGLQEDWAGE